MKLTGFLLALVCTTAAIVVAQNDTGSDVQSKIIALEKAWNQAYKLGDVRALDTLLDEQIVLINDDGSVQTKPEFLAGVKPSKSQEQQIAPESINVHVFGNTAIATGMFRAKGESKQANPTCGVSALSIPGFTLAASGCASPPMRPGPPLKLA